VYFGLDDGFNARARAANFPSGALREVADLVHRGGARAYVTLNTLLFEPELPIVEELIRRVAAAGIDAIIVQDPAVALLARTICPALEVHASTQMTVSSPIAAGLVGDLGLARIVVPRELSIDEIRAFGASSPTPLEVFIHGALCVAWSGQCLSSEAWGGRSANRGQCAQACRLPYELVVDGAPRDLGEVEYLLSPKDLVGLDEVGALADSPGVVSLKIEGRLKGPHYVAASVAHYRRAAAIAAGAPDPGAPFSRGDEADLHVAYSRGISPGFLNGADHQTLVEGRFPRHRGLPLGRVVARDASTVTVVPSEAQRPITGGLAIGQAPSSGSRTTGISPRAGMGVVFDRGRPEEDEQGGPIFGVEQVDEGWRLRFGVPGPDLSAVGVGDFVWVSSDPQVTRAGERAAEAGRGPLGRIPVRLELRGAAGEPLVATAVMPRGRAVARTGSALAPARGAGLVREVLVDKLGAFGGTAFHLAELDAGGLRAGLHVPVSELKELRRALVADLDAAVARCVRTLASPADVATAMDRVRTVAVDDASPSDAGDPGNASSVATPSSVAVARDRRAAASSVVSPSLVVLCRTDAQLDAALAAGARDLELDWMELVGLGRAVERARASGARVGVATVRVQKPGEERIDAHLARLEPDHVLVRSWGSLAYFRDRGVELHGDFSLNVANSITAGWVLARGLLTVTAAHDLDRDQLFAMLERAPRGSVAVTVHHHIPTFHTEHCVYAHLLSRGADFRTCGRPCERHEVALRDRVGLVHPVVVDVGCRNTVFNAQAQSAAALVPELVARGVRRFRVELVRESRVEATAVVDAYARLVAGAITPAEVVRRAAAHEQFGVTRGTMRTLTVLR
jgi:putative protease